MTDATLMKPILKFLTKNWESTIGIVSKNYKIFGMSETQLVERWRSNVVTVFIQ